MKTANGLSKCPGRAEPSCTPRLRAAAKAVRVRSLGPQLSAEELYGWLAILK
jgi:hypothetical protein